MPRPRRHASALEPAVAYFLAHGRLPDVADEPPDWARGFGSGKFEAFQLWGDAVRGRWEDIRELWQLHEAQIRAARADGEPWVARALREREGTDECR
jgi:hypothetical protein